MYDAPKKNHRRFHDTTPARTATNTNMILWEFPPEERYVIGVFCCLVLGFIGRWESVDACRRKGIFFVVPPIVVNLQRAFVRSSFFVIVFCHRFASASYEYYLLKKTFPGKIASIHYCNALTSHSFGWRSHILGRNIVFQTFHIAHVLKLWLVLIIVGVCLKLGSYKLKKIVVTVS